MKLLISSTYYIEQVIGRCRFAVQMAECVPWGNLANAELLGTNPECGHVSAHLRGHLAGACGFSR